MRTLPRTAGRLRCGRRPRPLARRRAGIRAIAAVILGIAVVLVPAAGPRHPAAHAAGSSLLDNAPAVIRSEVEIDGSPERVWQVLVDLSRYPVWNPFLYPVEGELLPGNPLKVTMHVSGRIVTYPATVLEIERNRSLSWSTSMFDSIYGFTIEPAPDGHTRLVARETRRGFARIVEWMANTDIQRGLDAMTRSVRNRVELLRPWGESVWPAITYSTR